MSMERPRDDVQRCTHSTMHRDLFDEDFPTLRVVPSFDVASRVPVVSVDPDEIPPSGMDHREGFLLSLVDGESTVEELLDVCAMPHEEALAVLLSLVDRGILSLE